MCRWLSVLPLRVLLEVHDETLIAKQEATTCEIND